MDAVLAQFISTFMIIVISYIAQRYFTFKIKEVDDEKEITD
jgi:putative flippase GtrA